MCKLYFLSVPANSCTTALKLVMTDEMSENKSAFVDYCKHVEHIITVLT